MNLGVSVIFVALTLVPQLESATLESSTKSLTVLVDSTTNVSFYLAVPVFRTVTSPIPALIKFNLNRNGIIKPIPAVYITDIGINANITIQIQPLKAGHVIISAESSDQRVSVVGFVRAEVVKSMGVETASAVVGWMYFVAWSVSFYPQVIQNFQRKSVIGLNFDFLALNLMGFTTYSIFNVGLYWIPSIQAEYFRLHPHGVNPVQANDVFFSLHAVFGCLVTALQCLVYQRGGQQMSAFAGGIISAILVLLTASALAIFVARLRWLQFLYFCSYIKLFITLVKYLPQAYMNYKRKSTTGWSIGTIFLDFTGGILSMLQMILISYNHDDWNSIFGNATKFGLGCFSIAFDVVFILQHYLLYRESRPRKPVLDDSLQEDAPLIDDQPLIVQTTGVNVLHSWEC